MPPRLDPEARVAAMLAHVRAAGLKLTPQRMAIVRELAFDPTHPTAQELFERLRRTLPTMSFATVYNTLDTLASAGLCAALSLSPGPARFDANMEPHHHAVCDRCGLVRDVAFDDGGSPSPSGGSGLCPQTPGGPESEHTDADIAAVCSAAPGFSLRSVERIYRGVCEACSRAAPAV